MNFFFRAVKVLFFCGLSFTAVAQTPFKTSWGVASGDSIVIPTIGSGYSYTIDWGDGETDATVYTGDAKHIYEDGGTYQVAISGDFPRIYFLGDKSAISRTKIKSVDSWGSIQWSSMEGAFTGCVNLVIAATDAPDLTGVSSMSEMFSGNRALTGDFSKWEVGSVTNMSEMFRSSTHPGTGIDTWDVSSVENMSGMFTNSDHLNIDLGNWDVHSVADMSEMFYSSGFSGTGIGNWDVDSVKNMSKMFYRTTDLNVDLSNWDVRSVTNMSSMFYHSNFSGTGIDNWDVSSVKNMSEMFYNLKNGLIADFSNWDVSSVTDMSGMFRRVDFDGIGLELWDISSVETMRRMLSSSELSIARYEDILKGWATLDAGESKIPTDVSLGATGLYYCDGSFRDKLEDKYGWYIGDYRNNNCEPIPDKEDLELIKSGCPVTPEYPTATDYRGNKIVGTPDTDFPVTSYKYIRWTYTDFLGNESDQSQSVYVTTTDGNKPVPDLESLPDLTSECAIRTLEAPSATDDCSAVTVTHDANLPITRSGEVTWTYTDASGNFSTQTQRVMVTDDVAPVPVQSQLPDVISVCPVVELPDPLVTDNCDDHVAITNNAFYPISTPGTTIVTWTFRDVLGNTTTRTQRVQITGNDNIAPVPDQPSLSEITGECKVESLVVPTATDNCGELIQASHDAELPITESKMVTWAYTDGSGNVVTQTQQVTITSDKTSPVPDQVKEVIAECQVTSLTPPIATDNCSEAVEVTTQAIFPITESTKVSWVYKDEAGNTVTRDQQVTIIDTTKPVPDENFLPEITGDCQVTSLVAPTATDNCSRIVRVSNDAVFPIKESTTVNWVYADDAGNATTQQQRVQVVPCLLKSSGKKTTTVNILPNPTKGFFHITHPDNTSIEQVDLINLNGQPVKRLLEKGHSGYDIGELANGAYTLRIVLSNKKIETRIIFRAC